MHENVFLHASVMLSNFIHLLFKDIMFIKTYGHQESGICCNVPGKRTMNNDAHAITIKQEDVNGCWTCPQRILKNTLFLHKNVGDWWLLELLGNMATKDIEILCTSLQDVQKNPKTILQRFKFGAQENKRVARFAMCWIFCVFLAAWIAIILPNIIFDWPFGSKSPVPGLSKYWSMSIFLAVSLWYFITMFTPNTGPWASIRKKTAKQKPMSHWVSGQNALVTLP